MSLRERNGFTLLELMIVVTIIGIIAAIAVPAYLSTRARTQANALANNFRVYSAAFEIYAMETGRWPPDSNRGVIPDGMEGQLPRFTEPSIVGGRWDWEYNTMGVTAGISLVASNASDKVLTKLDDSLDDGDLGSGRMVLNGDRITYALQP